MSFEQNEEIIVITADEAGEWKKEKVSVAGIRRMISERFSPDYREQMNTLREVDSQIRAWARSIRDNVKELKNAFKSGRIIDVAILFARFNKHLETVVDIGKDVEIFYEKSLAEFESGHELTDYSELEGLGNKEATLLGDLARKYISKRIYNREIKERNMAVRRLISKAEAVYKTIDTYLDGMKAAKKDGDIGRYVDFLRKISAKQKDFESAFIPTYNRYLKRSVELAMEHDKSKPEKGGLKGEARFQIFLLISLKKPLLLSLHQNTLQLLSLMRELLLRPPLRCQQCLSKKFQKLALNQPNLNRQQL